MASRRVDSVPCGHKLMEFSGDTKVAARREQVEAVLRQVCDADEFPWYVSDEATLLDVCSLTAEQIRVRLAHAYGQAALGADLTSPIWALADYLVLG